MRIAGKICTLSIIAPLLLWASLAQAQPKPKDAECLACHADATPSAGGSRNHLAIDPGKLHASIHGSLFSCVDCHKDVKSAPHEKTPAKVTCGQCHLEAQSAYAHSYHATARKPDGSTPATCTDCHGDAHTVLPASDPKSTIYHSNIPTTCGACHGQKFLMESTGRSNQPFVSYQQSVHGRAVEQGSQQAAVCTDCHGAHDILPANDAKSLINKFNVPQTCGKCHAGVQTVFMQSIHGQAISRGNSLAPVCTDCHGIHTIKAPVRSAASTSDEALSRDTCTGCHQGVRLTQEFGVVGNRVSTYNDSYHGLASKGGSVVAANCASCHGVHNILPSSDPRSTVNPANLDATCGQCHKGVTEKFTRNKVHVDVEGGQSSDAGSVAVRYIRWFYIPLILVVIGGMFLHNTIIWRAKVKALRRMHKRYVLRMTANQRAQHMVLLLSFFVLVLTGFALKYPDSWLINSQFAVLLGLSERARGILHRIAGVALIADGVYHILYVAFTAEGRRLIRDLFPTFKDATDAWGTMLYYTGFRSEKPKFARFNYAEKAEYWALVWGTVLMAVTGIMLWAKVPVGNLLARWWIDAATAVHFYEAILATLAIVVWHFYQVLFDPDVYPMNSAWHDGRIPAETYREEHELDTESPIQSDPDPGLPELSSEETAPQQPNSNHTTKEDH